MNKEKDLVAARCPIKSWTNRLGLRFESSGLALVLFPVLLCGGELTELRGLVHEWVAVEKAISQEAIDWSEKKDLLDNLTSLGRDELKDLTREIRLAAETASEADEKRAALIAEEQLFVAGRQKIQSFLDRQVPRLELMKRRLPQVLLDSLQASYLQLNASSSGLAQQMQAFALILDGIHKFDGMITVSEELRELPSGSSGMVKTVYVGFGAAYYLSEADDDAGIGSPSETGWVWSSKPEIGPRVSEVLKMLDGGKPQAAFVALPFELSKTP